MTFESRLAFLRTQLGLNQKELAAKLGIEYRTYNNYECGHRTPDPGILKLIANFYDVSIDYIVYRTDNPKAAIIKEELPQELKDLGIDYINVTRELKESGLSVEDIRVLANWAKNRNKPTP